MNFQLWTHKLNLIKQQTYPSNVSLNGYHSDLKMHLLPAVHVANQNRTDL